MQLYCQAYACRDFVNALTVSKLRLNYVSGAGNAAINNRNGILNSLNIMIVNYNRLKFYAKAKADKTFTDYRW